MNSESFGLDELDQLRKMRNAMSPGKRLVAVGVPVLVVVPMLCCCILSPFAGPVKDDTGKTAQPQGAGRRQPQQQVESNPLRQTLALAVLCAWIGGGVAIGVLQKPLNTRWIEKNTIRLKYKLPPHVRARFERLMKRLDELASKKLHEIVSCGDARYEHTGDAELKLALPKFVECNLDLFCLAVGRERYYFLPDCILVFVEGDCDYVRWNEARLKTNAVRGEFVTTRYRQVMAHGRIRKDGGLDRRYNTSFATQAYKSWESIQGYESLKFKLGREKIIFLVAGARNNLVFELEAAFEGWVEANRD